MRTIMSLILSAAVAVAASAAPRITPAYSAVSGWIEPNVGQTDVSQAFIARGGGSTLLIGRDGTTMIAGPSLISMKLIGAHTASQTSTDGFLHGTTSYFIGNDPKGWHTAIPHYASAELHDVYRGIDLAFRVADTVEYDFVVQPGGDPRSIRMLFDGADEVAINATGDLVVRASGVEVVQRVPAVYQEFHGERAPVRGAYALRAKNEVSFELGEFDASRPLVIDPVLVSVKQVGGAYDRGSRMAMDAAGNIFLCGDATGVTPATFGPGGGYVDGFVAKISSTGTLAYVAYVGGGNDDYFDDIAVDTSGNAYLAGASQSTDFPIVGTDGQIANAGIRDAVVLKLDSTASSIAYSYYVGGSGYDEAAGIAINAYREVFLTGSEASSDFPSINTIPPADNAWVAKLDAWGRLQWIYTIGGSSIDTANAIAINSVGQLVIVGTTSSSDFPVSSNAIQKYRRGGQDAFMAVVNTNGSIGYATYWGGSGTDGGVAVAVDKEDRIYVAGSTNSTDFPVYSLTSTPAGGYDIFVLKFMFPNVVVYSGTTGGAQNDTARAMTVDDAGCAYVTGETLSGATFPTKDALVSAAAGVDAFLIKLAPFGQTMYSTLIGGSASDVGFDVLHQPSTTYTWLAGTTYSTDFPLLPNPAGPPNKYATFLAKIDDGAAFSAPPRVTATASSSGVHVAWSAVSGATGYFVQRLGLNSNAGTQVGAVTAWDDTSVTPGTAYLYRVIPLCPQGTGFASEVDLAVVFSATDDPAVAGVTPVKAVQVRELRTAIDLARALAALPPYTYTYGAAAGTIIHAQDFLEMQWAINEARSALYIPRFGFTWNYVLSPTILAVHLNELRQAVR